MYIATYDSRGQYLQVSNMSPQANEGRPPPLVSPGTSGIYYGLVDPRTQYHDLTTKSPRNYPPKLYEFLEYDYTNHQWVDARALDAIQAAQWLTIKTAREAAINAGFIWDGSKFDSNEVSQARIQGAVILAGLDTNYTVAWTLFDNTSRLLSAADVIQVGMAAGQHVQTIFDKGRALRAAIDAAETREAVFAVVW